ncbi:hypothetical protein QL285_033157 [Trifolium repens]|nr:hypothetical protein QL285_033157 [Trifolium repens]
MQRLARLVSHASERDYSSFLSFWNGRVRLGMTVLLGKLNHTKSSTVLRLKAIWLKAKLPFELWLGQCCPIDPYLIGRLIWKLQQAFRPKDLVVPPTSTYKSETFQYLEDMTLLRCWAEAWLMYVRWYYATAFSPDVSIEDFFQALVVITRSFQRGVRTSLMLRLRLIENYCRETIAETGLAPKPNERTREAYARSHLG